MNRCAKSVKILRRGVIASVSGILLATGIGAKSATLNGPKTLFFEDDLTVVVEHGNELEFLDLSYTSGMSVAEALSQYATNGFRWANGLEVAHLFGAFGINYASASNAVIDITPYANLTAASNLLEYIGETKTGASATSVGYIDDLTLGNFHTYACISYQTDGCMPFVFVSNGPNFWPQSVGVGVFLVRDGNPSPVPEPSKYALVLGGLFVLGLAYRRNAMNV